MTRSTTVTDDVTKEWKLQDKLGVGSTSKVFKCVSVSNPRTADSGANRHTEMGPQGQNISKDECHREPE